MWFGCFVTARYVPASIGVGSLGGYGNSQKPVVPNQRAVVCGYARGHELADSRPLSVHEVQAGVPGAFLTPSGIQDELLGVLERLRGDFLPR